MKRQLLFNSLNGMQCHASNLLITKQGTIAVAFFAGTRESDPDTSIWLITRSTLGWRRPKVLVKLGMTPHWNPVLTEDDGNVSVFFKTGNAPSSWATHRMHLGKGVMLETLKDDDGIARGPVRSSILVASNGDWLAPASHEVMIEPPTMYKPPVVLWDSFVDRSEDKGKTWERTPFIEYDRKKFGEFGGTIQPTLWESKSGKIHMLLRSTIGKICRSDSMDYGKTWSPIEETDLPNNNSGIDVVKNQVTGMLALVYNPVTGNWADRTPISIAFSKGEGKEWSDPINIESGVGSFSYPSIRQYKEGFALTYTWNRTAIAYLELGKPVKEGTKFITDIEEVVNSEFEAAEEEN